MSSLNKVILIGRVESNGAEVRRTPAGTPVANFLLTTVENYNARTGEPKERRATHRITVWGKLAERAGELVREGAFLLVEGALGTDTRRDKNGNERIEPKITAYALQAWTEAGPYRGAIAQTPGEDTGPPSYFTEDDLPY